MKRFLLDTHAWIWWHMRPDRLSRRVRQLLATPSRYDELFLADISLWEFCKLIEKQRLTISCNPRMWMDTALDMPKLRVAPLTSAIASQSIALPPPFHNDPADQIIAATAREFNATILTCDQRLLAYPHVRTFW